MQGSDLLAVNQQKVCTKHAHPQTQHVGDMPIGSLTTALVCPCLLSTFGGALMPAAGLQEVHHAGFGGAHHHRALGVLTAQVEVLVGLSCEATTHSVSHLNAIRHSRHYRRRRQVV